MEPFGETMGGHFKYEIHQLLGNYGNEGGNALYNRFREPLSWRLGHGIYEKTYRGILNRIFTRLYERLMISITLQMASK